MADSRVHPTSFDAPSSSSAATSPKHSGEIQTPPDLHPSKPVPPPPASYVVQFPREQILRHPPTANASKLRLLNRRKNRGSRCRRCCCYTLLILLLLLIAAAVSAGVLYLVFRFKSPNYTVTQLTIRGMNLTSASPISPDFNATIRADNPNGKIGIYYLKNSAVSVFYNDAKLSGGVLPAFYQPKRNVTVMHTALTGSDVVLGSAVRATLRNAQSRRNILFVVRVKAPVKIKVGSVNTWEVTVRIRCDVILDALNPRARIVSNKCDYSVRLW